MCQAFEAEQRYMINRDMYANHGHRPDFCHLCGNYWCKHSDAKRAQIAAAPLLWEGDGA